MYRYRIVWYGMVNVNLYSAIITKVSNALNTLVSGEKPGFQALSKGQNRSKINKNSTTSVRVFHARKRHVYTRRWRNDTAWRPNIHIQSCEKKIWRAWIFGRPILSHPMTLPCVTSQHLTLPTPYVTHRHTSSNSPPPSSVTSLTDDQ